MRLKTFRASTVALAMAQVREDLGPEALILSTRRLPDGAEVTAALETLPPPLPDPARLDGLRWHGVPATLAAVLATAPLEPALTHALRFGRVDTAPYAPPILLAGPPGAGKTLTAARLATRFVLAGHRPLVICADGQRAAAAEQLAAFTRLLELPLLVAPDPLTLARALARREAGAPVLIDTAGIDPFDPAAQAALAALAAAASATTALVLPAGLDPNEAADTASAFAAAGATLLVATRLDVTRRIGSVLAAAHAGGERRLALAEAGIGPGAADGLAPLTPALLAHFFADPKIRKAA